MHFTKMHGIGNDYIYVDTSREHIADPAELAVRISDRHFGVGSDGLILINPSDQADFEMEMYNLDGSRGKMCGNGIRCVGKYVYDHGLTDQTVIRIETLAGIRTLEMTPGADGKIASVRVDMGAPILVPSEIPVKLPEESEDPVIARPFEIGGTEYAITCVSMGNPHCVVFMDEDIAGLDLASIGPVFEHHELFPEQVNTEFVNVLDENHIRMRVWERGSGETMACGTGACASAAASILNHFTKDRVTVSLLGGDLEIEWDREKNVVYMTGPAEEVFEGDYI